MELEADNFYNLTMIFNLFPGLRFDVRAGISFSYMRKMTVSLLLGYPHQARMIILKPAHSSSGKKPNQKGLL